MTRTFQRLALVLAAIVVAGASLAVAGVPDGLFGAALGAFALAIALGDISTFRIPDLLNAGLFAFGLAAAGVESGAPGAVGAFARGLAMAAALYAFRWLYARLRGVDGLGLGDVKLAAGAGAWLQAGSLAWAVELSAVSGILAALIASRVSTFRLTAGSRLPYGAFLAPSIWLCWMAERLGWI